MANDDWLTRVNVSVLSNMITTVKRIQIYNLSPLKSPNAYKVFDRLMSIWNRPDVLNMGVADWTIDAK